MTNQYNERRQRMAERFRFLAAVYGVVPTIVRLKAEDAADLIEAAILYGEVPPDPPRPKLVYPLILPPTVADLEVRKAESYVEALKYMLDNPNDPEVVAAAERVARTPIPLPPQPTYADDLRVLWQCGAYPRG